VAFDQGLVEWVIEAMEPVGCVTMRKMFGGAGLYCDGLFFALVTDDDLWIKGDAISAADWDALGAEPFSFSYPDGRIVETKYRRAPGDAHDDPEAMQHYGRLGIAAAMRTGRKPE